MCGVGLVDEYSENHDNQYKWVQQGYLLQQPVRACYPVSWCNSLGDISGRQHNKTVITHDWFDNRWGGVDRWLYRYGKLHIQSHLENGLRYLILPRKYKVEVPLHRGGSFPNRGSNGSLNNILRFAAQAH